MALQREIDQVRGVFVLQHGGVGFDVEAANFRALAVDLNHA